MAMIPGLGKDTGARLVRTVRLASGSPPGEPGTEADSAELSSGPPFGRTVIPAGVWNSTEFLYVGLEIYLTCEGQAEADDWTFARRLVEDTVACAVDR